MILFLLFVIDVVIVTTIVLFYDKFIIIVVIRLVETAVGLHLGMAAVTATLRGSLQQQ